MEQFLWLIPLGFLVGTFGTLIGAGGGFILVPILLFLYPDKSPETITSISLAVVFFNALSGSFTYARMKRIDFKSGLLFSIATLPGSILGVYTNSLLPRNIFNGIFGVLLMAASVFLIFRPQPSKIPPEDLPKNYFSRTLSDIDGNTYSYAYNPVSGVVISLLIGYISSVLGIGGGIVHVPMMIHILNFPVHIATSTSHFVLAITAFSGSVMHDISGILAKGTLQILPLSIGVLFGAQLGARLSKRFRGTWIIHGLAMALGIVGIRILIMAF